MRFDPGGVSKTDHHWIRRSAEVTTYRFDELGLGQNLGGGNGGEPMGLRHEVKPEVAERIESVNVRLAYPHPAQAIACHTRRKHLGEITTDLLEDSATHEPQAGRYVRNVLRRQVQLGVEQPSGLFLEVVSSRRTRKVTALVIGMMQEELDRCLAVGELPVLVPEEKVDLADRTSFLIDDLHTDFCDVDLANVCEPIVNQVFKVASDPVLTAVSKERLEVINVDGGGLKVDCPSSKSVTYKRGRRQHPLKIEECLGAQPETASGFGA